MGCRRWPSLGPRLSRPSDAADQRFTVYRIRDDAVARLGLADEAGLIVAVDAFTSEEGAAALGRLHSSGVAFDGIVCSNDSVAFACSPPCTSGASPCPPRWP